jgi:hypothetical protein
MGGVMSLNLVSTVAPCIEYQDWGTCWPVPPLYAGGVGIYHYIYGRRLVTCPRHYQESTKLNGIKFFYDPGADKYRAFFNLETMFWPGWGQRRYDFLASTGQQTLEDAAYQSIINMPYTNMVSMGSYNALYATKNSEYLVRQVDPKSLATGIWSCDPWSWTPRSLYAFAIVNRVDGYFAGVSSWVIDHWRNLNSTPTKFAVTRLPSTLSYMCYENRNYLWIICKDGTICKVDYQIPRYEMISTVQNPESDALGFAIAYDTKRKRICVLRIRPDAADGACQHQLEFYTPMIKATYLTAPVPINSLRSGNKVTFVSHLRGDAGEGATPYTVNAELAEPDIGRLSTPFSGTELSGRVSHQYLAPNDPCTDTIELSVEITEEGV